MTDQDARDAIVAELIASTRPLSFIDLKHPVRRTLGIYPDTGRMMSLLSRLVAQRLIVRRPVVGSDGEGSSALRRMDVQLCDFHPSGRDAWVDPPWRSSDEHE